MKRRLLNLLTALSLLLCVAVAVLWVRSYAPRDFTIGSDDGKLLLLFTDGQWTGIMRPKESYTVPYSDVWIMARGQATGTRSWLGVSYFVKTGFAAGGTPGRFLIVAVPFAYPALLSAAAAASSMLALARHRARSREGLCRKCGYNLTGNVSGVCPECGTTSTTPA